MSLPSGSDIESATRFQDPMDFREGFAHIRDVMHYEDRYDRIETVPLEGDRLSIDDFELETCAALDELLLSLPQHPRREVG